MTLDVQVREQLLSLLTRDANNRADLHSALRLLSKWRSVLIQNTLLQQQGTVVMQGPLAGLDFYPNRLRAATSLSYSVVTNNPYSLISRQPLPKATPPS